MTLTTLEYPGFELLQIRAERASEIHAPETSDYIRVELQPGRENIKAMNDRGYTFADRTIGVSINLRRVNLDYEKMVRFSMQKALLEDKPEILRIAESSFPSDSRFHIRPQLDQNTASVILKSWVENLTDCYVCLNKEKVIGFIDLEELSETETFIHLAAVEERYRAAGAALSMYAYVVSRAKEHGYQKISGRISSSNTAVMNLYSYLGGAFCEPLDVFVKEGNR